MEKYAPWVRNIYFVTWGHTPEWINKACTKLKIINHKDFIPQKYLPTFSTIPIELNLWRIKGLSEHFVYFNDDMFLMKSVKKEDFFENSFPKYCSIAKPIFPYATMTTYEHQMFNVAGVINSKFDVKKSIASHPEKWFSYKYGEEAKYNNRVYEDKKVTGMLFSHLGAPGRVSTMKEVWKVNEEWLDKTCLDKFRTMDDLIFQLFELWEMFNGTFEPVEKDYYGYFANIMPNNYENVKELILSESIKMICINDSEKLKQEDFEDLRIKISSVLNKKFPEKCSYEL